MRYAVYVPNFDTFGQPQVVAELACEAEAAGWDGFFLWDHLFADADSQHGPVADLWICLAVFAAQTRRIRLGALVVHHGEFAGSSRYGRTRVSAPMRMQRILQNHGGEPLVTPLARRRPWKLARETATLDQLAQGRLVVGVGIGGDWWREYSAFGEATDDRRRGKAQGKVESGKRKCAQRSALCPVFSFLISDLSFPTGRGRLRRIRKVGERQRVRRVERRRIQRAQADDRQQIAHQRPHVGGADALF